MSDLTEAARAHISKKNFALTPKQSTTGKPAYPIEDRAHARSALGLVGMHGSAEQKAEVRKDVARKYPDLLKKESSVLSRMSTGISKLAPAASEHADHLWDVGGLGILAAPIVDNMQARARARLSGDKGENAVEKRQFMSEPTHDLMELGGLGVLAAPGIRHLAHPSLPKLAHVAMLDELVKLGAVSDAQAQAAADRLETLERNKPTVGQAARYGAIGAAAGPTVRLVTDTLRHGNPLHGGPRGLAADAVGTALTAGAIPMVRAHFDRAAEKKTLQQYLKEEGG